MTTPIKLNGGQLENFVASTDSVPVNMGGTGATTQSGARTNLGLAIGTDVQAFDADLSALAALSSTGFPARTTTNTWALRTLTAPAAGFTITDGDGVAGNPTFVLANDLAALEGLSGTGIAVRTGTDTWTNRSLATASSSRITVSNGDGVSGNPTVDLATVSNGGGGAMVKVAIDSYGRVTDTSSITASDIGTIVDTRYVTKATNSTLSNGVVITLNSGTTSFNADDLVPKRYVDGVAAGMDWKASVRVATTTTGTLATAYENGDTVDGVTLVTGDRILIKNQSSGSENGIYTVNASGAPTRATDADANSEVTGGLTVWVEEGTTNADTAWTLTNDGAITVGTTALTFTQTSGLGQVTAGAGLTKTGNTLDIGTAASTRITVNANDIDLGQPVIGGSGAASGITKVTVDVYGRVTNTGTATPSDIGAQAADTDLDALAALSTTGLIARTGSGTAATRTITQPSAGITVTNGDGVSGNPTLALADDLAAVEGLSGTGIAVRTGTSTWTNRSLATANSGRITVSNGDGVSGNPTVDLASGIVTPGTYNSVTVDTYGRVTSGTASSTQSSNFNQTNAEGGSIVIGMAVYTFGNNQVKKAIASGASTKDVVGLVYDTSIAAAGTGQIMFAGVLTATTGQWDVVTGQTGGLTTGAIYYLDNSTAGHLTTTAPSTGWVLKVGIALSTTDMVLQIGQSIKL